MTRPTTGFDDADGVTDTSAENRADDLWRTYRSTLDEEWAEVDEAERARTERDFWKSLFNHLIGEYPQQMMAITRDGVTTHWNETMAEALNIPREEILGENAYELMKTDGQSETLAETIADREEAIMEDDFRENPTSDRIYRAYGVPLRGPDGTVVGALTASSDVSEYVQQRRTLERLQARVRDEIQEPVDELTESIDEVASFAEETDEFAADQIAMMERAASEVSEQSAAIQEIAANADQVNATANEAESLAEEGESNAQVAIDRMKEVEATAHSVGETIEDLTTQAGEIDEIVDVMNDIASQTNILALNASIEAARANEGGDEFAVVADEVKSLATESQKQSTRIETMIETMVEMTEQTAEEIEETTDQLTAGVDAVQRAMRSFEQLREAVESTTTGAQEVAEATDDHARSSEQLAGMVDDAVDELQDLDRRLGELTTTAHDQYQQVEDVKQSIDRLEQ